MEAPDREYTEEELAVAILLLWIIFSDRNSVSSAIEVFSAGFNQFVRPILTGIYGRARAGLAASQGLDYPTRSAATGDGQVVLIPGITRRVDAYGDELYRTFLRRQAADQEKVNAGEEPPAFNESDASRIAVTTTTQVHSQGEMDGGRDVETRTGKRLVAVWRTEPGACPICSPLEGTIREWRTKFPSGPPAHPNCRCSLEWRELLG